MKRAARIFSILTGAVAAAFVIAAGAALAAEPVASGEWMIQAYDTSGEWRVTRDGDALIVTLSDDFQTKRGPDLKIFLSPKPAGEITGRNATDGSVLVAELKSNRGGQTYRIEGVDISDYQSIIIHCEAFSKLWAVAPL